MARFKLHMPIQVDYDLIAIVSPLRNYRLAFFINRRLAMDFVRKSDLSLDLAKQQVSAYFPKYYFYEPLNKTHYYLLNNLAAASSVRMLPELKQADYLFMLKGNRTGKLKKEIVKQVYQITNVQACFEVKVDQLHSKQNLIFDDEKI